MSAGHGGARAGSGRRAAPLEVRVGKGNPGRRPLPTTAPPRIAGAPHMPGTLSRGARTFWRDYCELLARRGQLSVDSAPSLVILCETEAEVRALDLDCRKKGRFQTVKTISGSREQRVRPAYRALCEARRRLLAVLIEFGLTDASRGKVSTGVPVPAEPEQDPSEKYGIN